jgi:HEAT repeat protein
MLDKVDRLINVLFDNTAREDQRDDAAMDLGKFDDERALVALLRIASNPNEDETILDSCGTSIGEILTKKEKHNLSLLNNLAPCAKNSAYSFIKEVQPEWFDELNSDK